MIAPLSPPVLFSGRKKLWVSPFAGGFPPPALSLYRVLMSASDDKHISQYLISNHLEGQVQGDEFISWLSLLVLRFNSTELPDGQIGSPLYASQGQALGAVPNWSCLSLAN
jgi:hypothetical protein